MRVRDTLTGFVLGLTITWGVAMFSASKFDAKSRRPQRQGRRPRKRSRHAYSARVDSSMVAQAQHDSTAEKASRRAERIRLGAVAQRVPAVCITPGAPAGDVIMVPLDTALAWKYAWEAERTARLHAVRVLIPDLEASLVTANARIGVLEQGNALRDRKITTLQWRNKLTAPIGLGVGALVVLAVLRIR
jgi:hypothetical protein